MFLGRHRGGPRCQAMACSMPACMQLPARVSPPAASCLQGQHHAAQSMLWHRPRGLCKLQAADLRGRS